MLDESFDVLILLLVLSQGTAGESREEGIPSHFTSLSFYSEAKLEGFLKGIARYGEGGFELEEYCVRAGGRCFGVHKGGCAGDFAVDRGRHCCGRRGTRWFVQLINW